MAQSYVNVVNNVTLNETVDESHENVDEVIGNNNLESIKLNFNPFYL